MAQVQATQAFYTDYGGGTHVAVGDILDDSHEIVRNTPAEWWKALESRFAPAEEATAKAGTKRATKAPAKS